MTRGGPAASHREIETQARIAVRLQDRCDGMHSEDIAMGFCRHMQQHSQSLRQHTLLTDDHEHANGARPWWSLCDLGEGEGYSIVTARADCASARTMFWFLQSRCLAPQAARL